ncbi:MAG: extracellular solute-binding protein [Treponema sp.]|jgi:ABC-type glycerol-3-phosphate transport system substrate-binding protein|nr:extracellular solute-binding protein [Treponema sp.]
MIMSRTVSVHRYCRLILVFCLLQFSSCGFLKAPLAWIKEPATAILWTDRPEFALYAENFNTSQDRYKIEVRYFESLAQQLTDTTEYPDIAVGSWLKSASTRTLFRPLDTIFKNEDIDPGAFYSQLLALGRIEDKHYLFPVSFNIPALVFSRENSQLLSDLFVTDLEEIKSLGKEYNLKTNGAFSRMGFSPSWNREFLFIAATLFNTSFQEASPLTWDSQALEQAIVYIREWIQEVNAGIDAEDDFVFKYFYEPPQKLAITGRILFAYMNSSEFFTLSPEQRSSLNFRWIAGHDSIPLLEDATYLGVCKAGKAKKASTAFTQWFFQEETQRGFLEKSKANRLNETIFGIANGFSAIKAVTEQIFPQYYPSLLGHVPPETFLTPPNILPGNWTALKNRVILPYLYDRIRSPSPEGSRTLERSLSDWFRSSRGP